MKDLSEKMEYIRRSGETIVIENHLKEINKDVKRTWTWKHTVDFDPYDEIPDVKKESVWEGFMNFEDCVNDLYEHIKQYVKKYII